jgi:hypothetical protein
MLTQVRKSDDRVKPARQLHTLLKHSCSQPPLLYWHVFMAAETITIQKKHSSNIELSHAHQRKKSSFARMYIYVCFSPSMLQEVAKKIQVFYLIESTLNRINEMMCIVMFRAQSIQTNKNKLLRNTSSIH